MVKLKKARNYSLAKRSFDSVIEHYRLVMGVNLGSGMPLVVKEEDFVNRKSKANPSPSAPNPKRPTVLDFRCEVQNAVKLRLKGATIDQFRQAYLECDSADYIEREVHAQSVLGNQRHSIEQRCGNEFVKKGLYPVQKYFMVIR